MLSRPAKLTIHWNWNLTTEEKYFSSKSEAQRYVKKHGITFYEIENANEDAAYDCVGREIKSGDKVIWNDPETHKKIKYDVWGNPNCEMVKLWNKYGECEALPEECKVITK